MDKLKVNPKVVYISFVVAVVLLGSILIFLFVRGVKKGGDNEDGKEVETEGYIDDDIVLDAMNKENADLLIANGGNVNVLGKCAVFVNEYLSYISSANYESAYNMYATELVKKKGYSYSLETFTLHCEELRNKMGVDEDTVLVAHYTSYIETENYIILSLILGVRTGAVYDNAISVEYTLIKEGDKYKLLDFSYFDFEWHCMKFNGNDGYGVMIPE